MRRGLRADFRFDYLSFIVLVTVFLLLGPACSQQAALQAAGNNSVLTQPRIKVLPEKVTLSGKEARHRLLVQKLVHDELGQQVAKGIEFSTSNAKVVKVVNGVLVPVANGEATITARVVDPETKQSMAAITTVVVEKVDAPHVWSFQRHVQPVLTKAGCNSGACHGALAGKGGFRLSLRGYDTDKDFFNVTTQQLGRRVDLIEPALSLLLTKPTAAVPHKGGKRLDEDSLHYRVVSEWLADGAPAPDEQDARLTRLQMLPANVTLTKGQTQPMLVQAFYSDGRVEDITQWAKFTSANEAVATVDNAGLATVIGPGEGAISAWFGSKIVIGRITSPFEHQVSPDSYVLAGRRNFIDDLVLKQLRRLNLQP